MIQIKSTKLKNILSLLEHLCGLGLIWKIRGIKSSKNDLWLAIQVAYLIFILLTILSHPKYDEALLVDIASIVLLYIITWNSVVKILVRLQDIEEHVVICAWCNSVKHAGEFTDKISHSICPDCLTRVKKEEFL